MANSNLSDRKLAANRANAQKSTGPQTPEGKAASSLNAVKTGLTGRTVLLPTEDAVQYQLHLQRTFAQHGPKGVLERHLVQAIADTLWRLERITSLESGLLAIGCEECADLYPDKHPALRKTMIEAAAYDRKAPALKNLHIQEVRLRRRLTLDLRELEKAQHERRWDEEMAALARKKNNEPEPEPVSECTCGQCEALKPMQDAEDAAKKALTRPVASNLRQEEKR